MTFRGLFLSLLVVSLTSPAFAGTSQGWGGGGAFAPYEAKIAQENSSGELFRIQGKCKSACTMSRTSDITSMRRGVCAKASDIVISCSKALAKISPARLR